MRSRQLPPVLLVVSFLLAAAAVLCWLQFQEWRRQKEALAAAKQVLLASERKLAMLQGQRLIGEKLAAELEMLTRLLPEEPAEGRLLLDLQAGADLSGMTLLQISYGEHIDRQGYREIPLELQLEGKYSCLLAFLDYLRLSERAVRLQELRINERQQQGNFAISIKASTFFQP